MSASAINPVAVANATPTAELAPKPKARATDKVARQFEEVFIKQILQSAHALGPKDGGGYGGMALDALASGIAQGGGIGLARTIQGVIDAASPSGRRNEPTPTISSKGR